MIGFTKEQQNYIKALKDIISYYENHIITCNNFKNHERTIRVSKVSNNDIENLIEFEESWFFEGELLQDFNDKNHDIELIKTIDKRTFTYKGTAKVGELYYIKR